MVCGQDSSASKGKITKPLRAKIITQPLIKAKGSSKGALNSIICNFLNTGQFLRLSLKVNLEINNIVV